MADFPTSLINMVIVAKDIADDLNGSMDALIIQFIVQCQELCPDTGHLSV